MRKLIWLLLSIFLVGSITAQVYLPFYPYEVLNLESFRHQATFTIEDDLDNGIDGTDIFNVEGGRIFTNLSNLSSGTEELMDDYSDHTLVIGGISPEFQNLKAAFIYGNAKVVESGSDSYSGTEMWDENGDGSLDFMQSTEGNYLNEYSYGESCILLNLGYHMGIDTRVALTYERMQLKGAEEGKDSLYESTSDMTTGEVLYLGENYSYYKYSDEATTSIYNLSYSMPVGEWALRGDVYLLSGAINSITDGLSHNMENLAPSTPSITEITQDTSITTYMEDHSGNLIGLSLRLSDLTEAGLYWEVSGNFGMISGSGDYEESAYYHYIDQSMNAGNVSLGEAITDTGSVGPLSISGNNFGGSGRIEWQLSENVCFGLGLMFSNLSFSEDYEIKRSFFGSESYDDGDSEPNDEDDFIGTLIGSDSTLYTVEISTTNIIIPAGIELNFGKNKDWFLRLGAMADNSRERITYTQDVVEIERNVTTTIYGDGDTTVTYDNNIEYYDGKESGYYHYQDVWFAYGLGWKPSPNLSLDLLTMFDIYDTELLSTEWLKSLKLSATVSF
jgi:hypothetical protein